ncbi:MAG TPA: PQQ-binding-like beta-propeller repeat protein, partial [Pirellulales bacterium]|nr:PQQ-binding-like beta-propeller repeat protein [Pirellulales bacterium]
CLDRSNGTCRWTIDILADNGASNLFHGLSGSPLVVDGLVIVSAGGRAGKSLAAYDFQTGNCVWRSGDDAAGYGSPQLCSLADHDQMVVLNRSTLAAHDPLTGRVLWSFPWENSTGTNCSQCVPLAGRIFVSSGYGKGCGVLELTPNVAGDWSVQPVWTNRNLRTKFTSAVARDGFSYGLDEGVLCCIDLADGTRRWRAGRYGHGQLLLAGDKLVVQAESGEVALVAAEPDAWREFARFAALADKTWNHPALAGRLLLVRNDREAACYELPGWVAEAGERGALAPCLSREEQRRHAGAGGGSSRLNRRGAPACGSGDGAAFSSATESLSEDSSETLDAPSWDGLPRPSCARDGLGRPSHGEYSDSH